MNLGNLTLDGDEPGEMTHKAGVRRMAKWLQNCAGYSVVMAELATTNTETPDVLGFGSKGSILIEVKVSRADFLADKHKSFRKASESGMGDCRYFAAPKGILFPADLPPKWGLMEITKNRIYTTVEAEPLEANKRAEVRMLVSAIRRLELATAVFVRQEPEPPVMLKENVAPRGRRVWKCAACGSVSDCATSYEAVHALTAFRPSCPHVHVVETFLPEVK